MSEIEYGYDIENMKFYLNESFECEIPANSISKEDMQKILGGIPIIRCKNCKRQHDIHDYEYPYHTSGDPFIDYDPEDNFFCALGELKND